MENKFAIQFFTIILSLVTIYTLSFNFAAKNFEKLAHEDSVVAADTLWDSTSTITKEEFIENYQNKYLIDSVNSTAHVFGASYQEVKERELKLGLDLQGGMSLMLEVSIPDLLIYLSDYSTDSDFRTALANATARETDAAGLDYITLFADEWEKIVADRENDKEKELWQVFHTPENGDLFAYGASNDQIISTLRVKVKQALKETESLIRKRIDRLGVAQPNVQKIQNTDRILVELPGISDKERAKNQIQGRQCQKPRRVRADICEQLRNRLGGKWLQYNLGRPVKGQ